MKQYYYVYNRAQEKPLKRHNSKDEAIKEARRLCIQEKKNFYVLEPSAHLIYDHNNDVVILDVPEPTNLE